MNKMAVAPEFAHFIDDWHFSPVLDTGDFVFLSGVTGVHPDGRVSPDPETQFRDAFNFVAANLAAVGLGLRHIAELTSYHVGLRRHLGGFIHVKDEMIRPHYPAWTAVGVSELISDGTLVELRVIARRHREPGDIAK